MVQTESRAKVTSWGDLLKLEERPAVISPPEIGYLGFTQEQGRWVHSQLTGFGLPLDRLVGVRYTANEEKTKNTLGMCTQNNEVGVIDLFKSLEKLPREAQCGTMAHELAHLNHPDQAVNLNAYGSQEKMDEVQNFVHSVADQTIATGKYLNGYQRVLVEQFNNGQIDRARLDHETFAILVELRFTNSAHLQQVDQAQKMHGGKVRLMTGMFSGKAEGIDVALMALTKKNSVEELRQHLTKVKDGFRSGKPL